MSCTGAIGGPEHCVEVHHQRAILRLDQAAQNMFLFISHHRDILSLHISISLQKD